MKNDILLPLGIILALLYFTTKANAAGGSTGASTAGSGASPSPGSSTSGVASGGVNSPGTVVSPCPVGQNQYTIYHAISDYFENGCDPNATPGSIIIQNN